MENQEVIESLLKSIMIQAQPERDIMEVDFDQILAESLVPEQMPENMSLDAFAEVTWAAFCNEEWVDFHWKHFRILSDPSMIQKGIS